MIHRRLRTTWWHRLALRLPPWLCWKVFAVTGWLGFGHGMNVEEYEP